LGDKKYPLRKNSTSIDYQMKKNSIWPFIILILIIVGVSCKDEVVPPVGIGGDSLKVTETFVTNGINPAISPDGRKLAFSINGDIYTCDTNGSNAKQITMGGDYDYLPRWHPNGKMIGFVRTQNVYKNQGIVCTVDTATKAVEYWVDQVADSLTLAPAITMPIWDFSPDGNIVAFLSISRDSTYLRLFSYASQTILKSTYIYSWFPGVHGINSSGFSFSSSGLQIVFVGLGSDNYRHLFITNVNGDTTKYQIVDSYEAGWPTWSNSGDIASSGNIYDSTGIKKKTLTFVYQNAKWSPNGNYLLSETTLIVGDANSYEISVLYLTDTMKDKTYRITKSGDINKHNHFYVWDPSSKIIYYEKYKAIYKLILS
jgi:Tol biopolymer transport system component